MSIENENPEMFDNAEKLIQTLKLYISVIKIFFAQPNIVVRFLCNDISYIYVRRF